MAMFRALMNVEISDQNWYLFPTDAMYKYLRDRVLQVDDDMMRSMFRHFDYVSTCTFPKRFAAPEKDQARSQNRYIQNINFEKSFIKAMKVDKRTKVKKLERIPLVQESENVFVVKYMITRGQEERNQMINFVKDAKAKLKVLDLSAAPFGVLQMIAEKLSPPDVLSLCSTNKKFNEFCHSQKGQIVFRKIIEDYYGNYIPPDDVMQSRMFVRELGKGGQLYRLTGNVQDANTELRPVEGLNSVRVIDPGLQPVVYATGGLLYSIVIRGNETMAVQLRGARPYQVYLGSFYKVSRPGVVETSAGALQGHPRSMEYRRFLPHVNCFATNDNDVISLGGRDVVFRGRPPILAFVESIYRDTQQSLQTMSNHYVAIGRDIMQMFAIAVDGRVYNVARPLDVRSFEHTEMGYDWTLSNIDEISGAMYVTHDDGHMEVMVIDKEFVVAPYLNNETGRYTTPVLRLVKHVALSDFARQKKYPRVKRFYPELNQILLSNGELWVTGAGRRRRSNFLLHEGVVDFRPESGLIVKDAFRQN